MVSLRGLCLLIGAPCSVFASLCMQPLGSGNGAESGGTEHVSGGLCMEWGSGVGSRGVCAWC